MPSVASVWGNLSFHLWDQALWPSLMPPTEPCDLKSHVPRGWLVRRNPLFTSWFCHMHTLHIQPCRDHLKIFRTNLIEKAHPLQAHRAHCPSSWDLVSLHPSFPFTLWMSVRDSLGKRKSHSSQLLSEHLHFWKNFVLFKTWSEWKAFRKAKNNC